MNRERLLRLATYMEGVDRREYDQGGWLTWSDEASVKFIETERDAVEAVIVEGACGTARCVMGHAAIAIPEAGLYFRPSGPRWVTLVCRHAETGDLLRNFHAAAHVFDIPLEDAGVLFGSDEDTDTILYYTDRDPRRETIDFHDLVTPMTVAEKLREYVHTNGRSIVPAMLRQDREYE